MKLGRLVGPLITFLFALENGTASAQNKVTLQDPETLHELACSGASESDSPWHIGNLYDCESRSMFIPYHLWTGAEWDGNKDGPCMHEASTTFFVNRRSKTTIEGPKEWRGQEIWVRAKSDGSKTQYFECHDRGIGRVYENRKGRKRVYRKTGRCKFPAGYGWQMSRKRYCTRTAIELDKMEFDSNRELLALEFKWWYKARSGGYVFDHRYRYQPNVGSTNAWRQR